MTGVWHTGNVSNTSPTALTSITDTLYGIISVGYHPLKTNTQYIFKLMPYIATIVTLVRLGKLVHTQTRDIDVSGDELLCLFTATAEE